MLQFALVAAIIFAVAALFGAAMRLLSGHDETEWHLDEKLFPVRTIGGERVSGWLMTRKINGKREYLKLSDEEIKDIEDHQQI